MQRDGCPSSAPGLTPASVPDITPAYLSSFTCTFTVPWIFLSPSEFNYTPSLSIILCASWLLFPFAPFYYKTYWINGPCPLSCSLSKLIHFHPSAEHLRTPSFSSATLDLYIAKSKGLLFIISRFGLSTALMSLTAFHENFFSCFSHVIHHNSSSTFIASSSQFALPVTFSPVYLTIDIHHALPSGPYSPLSLWSPLESSHKQQVTPLRWPF